MSLDTLVNKLIDLSVSFGSKLLVALLVFFIGRWIVKKLNRLVINILTKRHVEASLATFTKSLVSITLNFTLVIIIISVLGIETSSFIALFASAGVAVGMALSGTLQNFAGGVMILLFKPFKVYTSAAAEIATLDADDQSILYTPLFTYAANPDANKTISFGNYLAALYAEIVTNDPATGLPEGASVEAFAGGVTEPEYGEITRGDLMAALPATARIQLVSTTAEAARALADGGTVSRVYQNSLTEYAPEGDVVYIVTDTATLAGLGAEYTVLRDYGDVFWSVRMNINDLTANFTTEFVLPEAPQYGVGRRG